MCTTSAIWEQNHLKDSHSYYDGKVSPNTAFIAIDDNDGMSKIQIEELLKVAKHVHQTIQGHKTKIKNIKERYSQEAKIQEVVTNQKLQMEQKRLQDIEKENLRKKAALLKERLSNYKQNNIGESSTTTSSSTSKRTQTPSVASTKQTECEPIQPNSKTSAESLDYKIEQRQENQTIEHAKGGQPIKDSDTNSIGEYEISSEVLTKQATDDKKEHVRRLSIIVSFETKNDEETKEETCKEEEEEKYSLFLSDDSCCSELSEDDYIDSDDETLASVNRVVKRVQSFASLTSINSCLKSDTTTSSLRSEDSSFKSNDYKPKRRFRKALKNRVIR